MAPESYLQLSNGTLQDWGGVSMDKVSTVNHKDLGLDIRFSSKSQTQWHVPINTVLGR